MENAPATARIAALVRLWMLDERRYFDSGVIPALGAVPLFLVLVSFDPIC